MKKRFDSISEVYTYLDGIPKFKDVGAAASNMGLASIQGFCEYLGNPQEQFRSIHVAGTNGKGTTCYLLSEIYSDQGYKTGLYTSPHLLKYNERVQVNGQKIPDEDLLVFFNSHYEEIERTGISYFEISTALAFWYFAQSDVDIAIIETGLGGRLDATNIISPLMSVITSISFDHMDILGNSIQEIASEKAGIIKENTPLVIGNLQPEAREEIEKFAESSNSNVLDIDSLQPEYLDSFRITEADGTVVDLGNALIEPVNRYNYAMAWLVVTHVSELKIEQDRVVDTFKNMKPYNGRFEQIGSLEWYVCGAHNQESYISMMEVIATFEQEPIFIFTSMKDKLDEYMGSHLRTISSVYYYKLEGDRAASFDEVLKYVPQAQYLTENDVLNKLKDLRDVLVIFAGSFYFYDTVKRWTGQFVT